MRTSSIFFLLCFWAFPLLAKDLGTQGHTYQILEPDLLQQITHKLQALEAQGTLQAHQQRIAQHAQHQLQNPSPVTHITNATASRTFYYNPAVRVPFDLKDHEGRVFHKRGQVFNPLKIHGLPGPLVFIDGRDPHQLTWAHEMRVLDSKAKVILTAGSPFELIELWRHRVYFDQGGRLTSKLGIKHTPALVSQEGFRLKIEEVLIEDRLEETRV